MKKILTFLFGMLLITGCTKDDKAEVVPVAPENLTGVVISNSAINLTWTDRSTNETGFKIERKLVGGTFEVIGTTATDIATFSNTSLTPATTYIYRVYSYNEGGNSPTYTTELSLTTTALLPSISTTAATSITTISATSGGTITADGGATITVRGLVWSTSANPTIANSKTTDGAGKGSFISAMTGLNPTTKYYVKAYATNSAGTAYGTELSFTTATPFIPTITNGTQFWQNANLNVSTYSDGTPIPQVTDPTTWSKLTTGAWCYYNNDSANGAIYGKLYNWYAVAGIHDTDPNTPNKKLAPTGYHVPSDTEWSTLTTYLGGESVAGSAMKETGTAHWNSLNTDASNSSGFTALPGGFRSTYANYNNVKGIFYSIGSNGYWWSSSEVSYTDAWNRDLYYSYGRVNSTFNTKTNGFSVRCIKD